MESAITPVGTNRRDTPGVSPDAAGLGADRSPTGPSLLTLQRFAGNAAVGALLRAGIVRAKLRWPPADDPLEREADRVSDEVMRVPEAASRVAVQWGAGRRRRFCSGSVRSARRRRREHERFTGRRRGMPAGLASDCAPGTQLNGAAASG